jgi:hypothetical protein
MSTVNEALATAIGLHNAGRLHEAQQTYRQVVAAAPANARAWHLLGVTAYQLGEYKSAADCAQRSLELNPDQADVHNNLGLVFHDQGMLDEAAECYRRALTLNPTYATAFYNLAHTLREQKRLSEAADCCHSALQLLPGNIESHVALGAIHLLGGDFEHGWPEYEWRLKADAAYEFALSQFKQPQWKGEPLTGKTILLHSEQGLGDTIQFVRYAPLFSATGANVLVGCKRPLIKLLESCPGINCLLSDGDPLPPYDFYSPLVSVPNVLRTTLDTIPANVPYVFADPVLVAQWREKLASEKGYRIGINWRGQGGQGSFRQRDIPLQHFLALTSLPSVQLIPLQKDLSPADSDLLAESPRITSPDADFDTAHGAFMDTAAITMNVDLVITCDTAIAHLAGALGVPVWVALPFVPDWRWLLDRADSPWYPTMRLFRQKSPGDWTGVFQEIRAALQDRIRHERECLPRVSKCLPTGTTPTLDAALSSCHSQ